MKKCLLWGMGQGYQNISTSIKLEMLKNNLSVVAIVSKDIITNNYDGYKVITSEMIDDYEFDYIIITSDKFYDEIRQEIIDKGINENLIIKGSVFNICNFDFERYINLIEHPITILTEDCMAGYLYKYLGLRFSSPTINTLFDEDDYALFISNFTEYISKPLELYREGSLRRNEYPIGIIRNRYGGGVKINFVHCTEFKEAKQQWDRRKERVHTDNIFIKWGIDASNKQRNKYLHVFDRLEYKKICFYSDSTDISNVVLLKRFLVEYDWKVRGNERLHSIYYNDYVRDLGKLSKSIDILKLLNGEKNYLREV